MLNLNSSCKADRKTCTHFINTKLHADLQNKINGIMSGDVRKIFLNLFQTSLQIICLSNIKKVLKNKYKNQGKSNQEVHKMNYWLFHVSMVGSILLVSCFLFCFLYLVLSEFHVQT